MDSKLSLNFVPFSKQNFTFRIFRRKVGTNYRTNEDQEYYHGTLPISDSDGGERGNYALSFVKNDGFDECACDSHDNTYVTLWYLRGLLRKKLEASTGSLEFRNVEDEFERWFHLILRHTNEGDEELVISPYYLRINRAFGLLVDYTFSKGRDVPFDRKVQILSLSLSKDGRSNRNFYIDKYNKVRIFFDKFYSVLFPLSFADDELDLKGPSLDVLPTETLKTKKYLVKHGEKEDNSQFRAILTHGPFTSIDKELHLHFLFRKQDRAFAIDLAKALEGKLVSAFPGMEKFFRIPHLSFHGVEVDFDRPEEIEQDFVNAHGNDEPAIVIPVLILPSREASRYYDLKYRFLQRGVATQDVTMDLLRNQESVKWSVANIALQVFAKAGGVPWIVKPEDKKGRTLIIGIGQAHEVYEENSRFIVKKYFAYSILTDSSGVYKELKVLSETDNEGAHLLNLDGGLKAIVNKYSDGFDNFILHVPFKLRRLELEQINRTLSSLQNGKRLVVLRINADSKFFAFNNNANSLVPYESSFVKLSNRDFLVWFEGLQYHNPVVSKRVAGPVLVEFYYPKEGISKEDGSTLLQDALNLSGANWRGFNSKSLPISLTYAQQTAKFIKGFRSLSLPYLNIENIKPWFL